MKFLIDECLTVDLVSIATRAGHEAQHVARSGKAGWQDWNLMRYATADDYVMVTNNRGDFRALYAREPLHPGLVIIVPNAGRENQLRLFQFALEVLAETGEPVNRALEIDVEGDEMTYDLHDLFG